jgi:hypothetical protein
MLTDKQPAANRVQTMISLHSVTSAHDVPTLCSPLLTRKRCTLSAWDVGTAYGAGLKHDFVL